MDNIGDSAARLVNEVKGNAAKKMFEKREKDINGGNSHQHVQFLKTNPYSCKVAKLL